MRNRILSTLLICFVSTALFAQNNVDIKDLEKKGRLYFYNSQLYNGTVFSKFDNGEIGLKGSFVNGEKDGVWEYWYSNGQQKRITPYKGGKKEGLTTYWHLNGVKSKEILYKSDKNIDQKLWDEQGNRLPNPSFQQSF